jgi:hypothetical protein
MTKSSSPLACATGERPINRRKIDPKKTAVMVVLELLVALAFAFAIVTTVTMIAAHAQNASFYDKNGSFAGSNERIGNSISFYDPQGRYQGSVTTMPPSSFDRRSK